MDESKIIVRFEDNRLKVTVDYSDGVPYYSLLHKHLGRGSASYNQLVGDLLPTLDYYKEQIDSFEYK